MTEPDRDEKVTQTYRALGGEEPPRALDEAILAASRRSQHRWRVPLSIAAVLVLAVGVTLRMLPQRPDAESVALAPQVIETPKPAAASAEPAAKFAHDLPSPAAAGAGAPSAAAPRAPVAAASVAGAVQRDDEAAAEGRARALASAPPAPAAAKLSDAALTPEAWLKRIVELRQQGREREAQESLAEFKKRYPDYKIPEALR
jgi:hypothetical protein